MSSWYIPPEFGLFEADFGPYDSSGPEERWIVDWQGRVGYPAESVSLGIEATRTSVQAIVSTRLTGELSEFDNRVEALRLAAVFHAAGIHLRGAYKPLSLKELAVELPRQQRSVSVAGVSIVAQIMPIPAAGNVGYATVGHRVISFATMVYSTRLPNFIEVGSESGGTYIRSPSIPMTQEEFREQDRLLQQPGPTSKE